MSQEKEIEMYSSKVPIEKNYEAVGLTHACRGVCSGYGAGVQEGLAQREAEIAELVECLELAANKNAQTRHFLKIEKTLAKHQGGKHD